MVQEGPDEFTTSVEFPCLHPLAGPGHLHPQTHMASPGLPMHFLLVSTRRQSSLLIASILPSSQAQGTTPALEQWVCGYV